MYEYRALVKKVYDGDTITVDIELGFDIILRKQKIRLIGVAAPEVRGEQKSLGLKSRDALREKIKGKRVTLRTQKDKKGKFGRWLAEVWIDELCVNDWLIQEGLASKYII